MAEWNLKYEAGFTIPKKEQNFFLKTINDFVELSSEELKNLNEILKNQRGRR